MSVPVAIALVWLAGFPVIGRAEPTLELVSPVVERIYHLPESNTGPVTISPAWGGTAYRTEGKWTFPRTRIAAVFGEGEVSGYIERTLSGGRMYALVVSEMVCLMRIAGTESFLVDSLKVYGGFVGFVPTPFEIFPLLLYAVEDNENTNFSTNYWLVRASPPPTGGDPTAKYRSLAVVWHAWSFRHASAADNSGTDLALDFSGLATGRQRAVIAHRFSWSRGTWMKEEELAAPMDSTRSVHAWSAIRGKFVPDAGEP